MNILDSNEMTENPSDNLMSFKDCPNGCIDGKIFDPYTHKSKICPYCAEKRRKFARGDVTDKSTGKALNELLNLPMSYTGNEFNEDLVIPEFAKKELTDESMDNVLAKLRELVTNMSIGKLPDESLIFNLGKKSNEVNFIYPYLVKGYIAGRSVLPLVNAIDICYARTGIESNYTSSDLGYTYKDLLDRDVCVIVIDAGATSTSFNAVKGVMQLRAQRLKPTIIFTNSWSYLSKDLCTERGYSCYNLATLYSVEYKEPEIINKDDNQQRVVQASYSVDQGRSGLGYGISSETMRNLMTAKNSL